MRVRCRTPRRPQKWPRRRMMPVLSIAGELVGAARSGPRETWHPGRAGRACVRAPRVAKAHTSE